MLRKIFLSYFFCLSFLASFAQCDINPKTPKLDHTYVYTMHGASYSIQVEKSELNEAIISIEGKECIGLKEFKIAYHSFLLEKSVKEEMILARLLPNLIINADVDMEIVEQVLVELQLVGVNRVLFSVGDLNALVSTNLLKGLKYNLNELNLQALNEQFENDGLATRKIENIKKNIVDSLQNAMFEKIKREGIPPPPPPPPMPPSLITKPSESEDFRDKYPFSYVEAFDEGYTELEKYKISVNTDGTYGIGDDQKLARESFSKKLLEIDINVKTFFILEYTPNATYEMYLNAILEVSKIVENAKKEYCESNSLGDLYKLDFQKSRDVYALFPMNIIEKRLYYQLIKKSR